MKPTIPSFEQVQAYLKRMDASRWYSNHGPLHEEAVARLATFFNVDANRICMLSNATLALISCISLSPETDWLIPEYTFSATGLAAKSAGKNVYSADVDSREWILKVPEETNLNLGLTPVMPYGKAIEAKLFNFPHSVIVDAAASIGALQNDFSSMKKNDAVIYSLHATKILGCGEGAVVICGSHEFATRLKQFANFGFINERVSQIHGLNAKLSEIHTAYVLASLDAYDETYVEWRQRLDLVDEISRKLGIMNVTNEYAGIRPYWIATFAEPFLCSTVEELLNKEGIQTRRWWPALMSDAPGITSTNVGGKNQSEILVATSLGLPLWQDLPMSVIGEIGDIVKIAI